jgi:hypothetical protein
MFKWPMWGHFENIHFKTFPMTPRTPQCEVFWPLLPNSKHLGVPEDSKSLTLGVWVSSSHLAQSGVATSIMDYLFMVMMFQFNSEKGIIYIHRWVENHFEICLMEDHYEEDHLIETHLEDHHLMHMFDFTDGLHLIQKCSCHHGTHLLQFDLNQPINCHIGNFNI